MYMHIYDKYICIFIYICIYTCLNTNTDIYIYIC